MKYLFTTNVPKMGKLLLTKIVQSFHISCTFWGCGCLQYSYWLQKQSRNMYDGSGWWRDHSLQNNHQWHHNFIVCGVHNTQWGVTQWVGPSFWHWYYNKHSNHHHGRTMIGGKHHCTQFLNGCGHVIPSWRRELLECSSCCHDLFFYFDFDCCKKLSNYKGYYLVIGGMYVCMYLCICVCVYVDSSWHVCGITVELLWN